MGYILPITQYTYVNYQARMMDSKKSPHYIGKPYKVVFNKIQQNHPDTYAQNRHYHMDKDERTTDRKSTRLNSSHVAISYAVFCLKKKKKHTKMKKQTHKN